MKQIIFTAILILTLHFIVFSQAKKDECPEYVIVGPAGVTAYGDYAVFQLKGDEKFEKLKPSYVWTVSDAEIFAGQGTKIVVVSPNASAKGASVKAVAAVQGLPKGCVNTVSETIGIMGEPPPRKVNEYANGQPGSIKMVIDTFYSELQNDPTASAVIIIKSKTKENIVRQIQPLLSAMYFRKYDSSRVTLRIIFDKDAEEITQYWIVPIGADFPFTENAININASEYKNIQNFFATTPRRRRK